jgi:hypothetical protein
MPALVLAGSLLLASVARRGSPFSIISVFENRRRMRVQRGFDPIDFVTLESARSPATKAVGRRLQLCSIQPI